MYSSYVALTIFFLFSLFMPLSMILTSIMLRNRTRTNAVGRKPYESAEISVGNRISIMNEYLHYFSIFIAFEILVVFVLLWVVAAPLLSFSDSLIVLALLVLGFIFEMLIMMLSKGLGR
ncbi:MAG: NADH-quinone oxidoreductase subunit A [Candidatus Micrarchaeota archaeon]|nr:NADH-quinone oxidoreductase subunit A [Candidatus Micrarchaeota archaeon]